MIPEATSPYVLKALHQLDAPPGSELLSNARGITVTELPKRYGQPRRVIEGIPFVGVDTVVAPDGTIVGYVDRRTSSVEERFRGRQLVERVFSLVTSATPPS